MRGPSQNWIDVFPGVHRRRLVASEQIYQMEVRLDEGGVVPLHHHPQEQIAYVVSGRLRFQVGEEMIEALPGTSVGIPANTPHAVWVLEESLVVDTFSPPRDDYLAADGD
jgi:quercetin dioxygenase-like cupin family protein